MSVDLTSYYLGMKLDNPLGVAACPPLTGASCASEPTKFCSPRTCLMPLRSEKPSNWRNLCPPTSRQRSSTGFWGAFREEQPRLQRNSPCHSLGNSSKLGFTRSCPGWDSNPHWTVFETASSTGWDTGARRPRLAGRAPGPRWASTVRHGCGMTAIVTSVTPSPSATVTLTIKSFPE